MSPSAVSFVHFRFFDMCRFCIITLTVIQPTPDICVYMDYIYRRFYIWVSWFYRRAMSIAIALHAQGCKTWGFCLQIPLFLLPWWSLRNARVLCFASCCAALCWIVFVLAVAMLRPFMPHDCQNIFLAWCLSEYIPDLLCMAFSEIFQVMLFVRVFTGETICALKFCQSCFHGKTR